jgi:hypothetical protein
VSSHKDPGYQPLLPFDTDDPEFARGFEAGRLWTRLRADGDALEANVCIENAEMVLRIAEATGRTVRSEELGSGWLAVSFGVGDASEIR